MLQLRQSQSQRHKVLPCQLHEMRTLCSLFRFLESKLILDVTLMIWVFLAVVRSILPRCWVRYFYKSGCHWYQGMRMSGDLANYNYNLTLIRIMIWPHRGTGLPLKHWQEQETMMDWMAWTWETKLGLGSSI